MVTIVDSEEHLRLASVVISPNASIAEAIARLDKAGTGALVLCSDNGKLVGVLTDGDLRRAVLRSTSLDVPCVSIANCTPIVSFQSLSPADALHLMNQHDISHLPVLDAGGLFQSLILRKDLDEESPLSTSAGALLESVVISPGAPLTEAIALLDKAGTGALVLCSTGRKLAGLLTDGDIRRAILRGVPLDQPCESVAIRSPLTKQHPISAEESLRLMNQHDVNHLPIVDTEGNVVEFRLRRDLSSEEQLELAAVVMAGGYGKRLLPLTEQVPKPMLPVGDRPLLELTIQQLRRSGIRSVKLTTHYLPENIMHHFGDGKAFGVNLTYLAEEFPMGTAGGLRLMGNMVGTHLVINGDILTGVSFQEMLNYHRKYKAELTVGVRKYEIQVPFGVVECSDVHVTQLQEKPSLAFFVNAGVYLMEPSAFDSIPVGQRFDMTDLIQQLMTAGRTVVSFPIMEYWLDVGRHEDYLKAQDDVRSGKI